MNSEIRTPPTCHSPFVPQHIYTFSTNYHLHRSIHLIEFIVYISLAFDWSGSVSMVYVFFGFMFIVDMTICILCISVFEILRYFLFST